MSKIENNVRGLMSRRFLTVIIILAWLLLVAGLVQTRVVFRQRAIMVLSELDEMNDKADQILAELEGMK